MKMKMKMNKFISVNNTMYNVNDIGGIFLATDGILHWFYNDGTKGRYSIKNRINCTDGELLEKFTRKPFQDIGEKMVYFVDDGKPLGVVMEKLIHSMWVEGNVLNISIFDPTNANYNTGDYKFTKRYLRDMTIKIKYHDENSLNKLLSEYDITNF